MKRNVRPIIGYIIIGGLEARGVLWSTSGRKSEAGGLFNGHGADLYPTRAAAQRAIRRSVQYWYKVGDLLDNAKRYRIRAVREARNA
ncbi:MAG: hypothetical protein E4H01_08665 [Lysobacterales bacterium]|nr:MAG: hypothetical protein E4H01_08665 [Xanthomonadales bacterium]